MTVLEERGRLVTKINVIFSVGNEVLNIFHLTIVLKKTVFSKMTAKNNLGGTRQFLRERRRLTKMNITFSVANGVQNTGF